MKTSLRMLAAIIAATCAGGPAAGEIFFVGKDGREGNPGTRKAPFATIQEGVDRCKPGDECVVLPGVYRESVRLSRSGTAEAPIRIRAEGEVVLDGTEPIVGEWEHHNGAVWRIVLPGPTVEQAFSEGVPLSPARWPNARFEETWIRSTWAKAAKGSKKDLMVCDALAGTGIDWTGAIAVLNVGHQYKTWTRRILTHGKGKRSFSYALEERLGDGSDAGGSWWNDCFYISGSLRALDAPGEWFHDAEARVFYVATGDGQAPPSGSIQVKRRDFGIAGSKLSDVRISGFRTFACAIRLDKAERCTIEQCDIRFPSGTMMIGETMPTGERFATPLTGVSGSDNLLRGLYVAYASGGGIQARGCRNRIEDCIVHDVCWSGTINFAGIGIYPSGSQEARSTVSRCTVYNVGNIGIAYRGRANVVEYNYVHHTGLACQDIAAIHTGSPYTADSVARYNWVSHSMGKAIRGDDQTRELTIHHNLVWNCDEGIICKGDRNRVYNNTILGSDGHGALLIPTRQEPKKWWTKHEVLEVQNANSQFFNNYCEAITYRHKPLPQNPNISHNILYGKGMPFAQVLMQADAAALESGQLDARPRAHALIVDRGKVVKGLTDGHAGAAPDVGAYESGQPLWRPGAQRPAPDDIVLPIEAEVARSWGLTGHGGGGIPMPKALRESRLSKDSKAELQALYGTCWTPDEIEERREAIQKRSRHEPGSEEYERHHAVVAKLHQAARKRLIRKAATVLQGEQLELFRAAMGVNQ